MGNIKKVPLRKCIGCNEMKNKKENDACTEDAGR